MITYDWFTSQKFIRQFVYNFAKKKNSDPTDKSPSNVSCLPPLVTNTTSFSPSQLQEPVPVNQTIQFQCKDAENHVLWSNG